MKNFAPQNGARWILPLLALAAAGARADTETWSVHGQATFVEQYHPAFRSPYAGPNSLDPGSRGNETFDATLFAGVRLWDGGEAYADPEIDQGFGLSDTTGLAGFSSGEAYKVGSSAPYFRLQRLFFRQTFDLGGDTEGVEADANQLAGTRTADHLIVTLGKYSVTDVFDTNTYAHDPKSDFLNWAVIDAGTFDYAADAWGYSYGITAELTQGAWTWRAGLFDLSRVPNSTQLQRGFGQYELVTEAEKTYKAWNRPGKIRLLAFLNRGRMGSYRDALDRAALTHAVPDTALVRRPASRAGASLNIEQALTDNLGAFLRAGMNDGSREAYEFTEINRSIAAGLSLKGAAWLRPDDTAGIAFVANALSSAARAYFAAGGIGVLIGDGRLPRYGTEDVIEAIYDVRLTDGVTAGTDYQFVANPAYNRDRGPVSILSFRLHMEF
ncbi:MAG: carbohydrate porin [Alphaproteobacteria bacterium]|nr:carbohydrate porin [Alphaproteobacteria bacterium]